MFPKTFEYVSRLPNQEEKVETRELFGEMVERIEALVDKEVAQATFEKRNSFAAMGKRRPSIDGDSPVPPDATLDLSV